mgnify:CR=1 FL=1
MVRELDDVLQTDCGNFTRMMMEASLIIMDEPTTSLTDPEIERVFDMMRMLQKQNVAIVFISHKLKEVMESATGTPCCGTATWWPPGRWPR